MNTPPKFKPKDRVRLGVKPYRYGTVAAEPKFNPIDREWQYRVITGDSGALGSLYSEAYLSPIHVKQPSLLDTYHIIATFISGELKRFKVDALNYPHALSKGANTALKNSWPVKQITVEK